MENRVEQGAVDDLAMRIWNSIMEEDPFDKEDEPGGEDSVEIFEDGSMDEDIIEEDDILYDSEFDFGLSGLDDLD